MRVEKVIATITKGDRLLVFSHPHHPEAGIQVPAGTVESGESPDEAVLREAREETGLDGLLLRSALGVREYDLTAMSVARRQRFHFYHLTVASDAPCRWRHFEEHPSDGSATPIEFELFWVQFASDVPELIVPQRGSASQAGSGRSTGLGSHSRRPDGAPRVSDRPHS